MYNIKGTGPEQDLRMKIDFSEELWLDQNGGKIVCRVRQSRIGFY